MTGSRPNPDLPDDLDPTGVRALLANLPDPGPMPEDLVSRISRSLELEQHRRAGGDSAYPFAATAHDEHGDVTSDATTAADDGTDGGVISLAAERHRRRPGRTVMWLGSAAAVAMVATISANQLLGDGTSDSNVSAQYPAASDSAREGADAGSDEAGPEAPAAVGAESDDSDAESEDGAGDGGAGDGTAGALTEAGAPVWTTSGTVQLTDTGVGEQLSSWVASGPLQGAAAWTPAEADDCITDQGLDTSAADQVMVSDATWAGEPAMVLVALGTDGGTAWVLTTDCGDVLSGPVALN